MCRFTTTSIVTILNIHTLYLMIKFWLWRFENLRISIQNFMLIGIGVIIMTSTQLIMYTRFFIVIVFLIYRSTVVRSISAILLVYQLIYVWCLLLVVLLFRNVESFSALLGLVPTMSHVSTTVFFNYLHLMVVYHHYIIRRNNVLDPLLFVLDFVVFSQALGWAFSCYTSLRTIFNKFR